MVKGKEKFALWITPECKQLVDDCYADDQCQSRSEYIEKAILFYTGFLYAEKADRYLPIVDELEKMPEVAAYYAVWNDLRDTLEGYYKNRPRQHNPLSQQKEFRAIKNAIIQEAERLRCQLEESSAQTSANPLLTDEHISSITSQFARLPSEYLLNSTVRLFHQMGKIFRDNAAPSSNPMGIRIDSKRRKKLMQKRLALGHKQDDHLLDYDEQSL